jgi:hypothetical protein
MPEQTLARTKDGFGRRFARSFDPMALIAGLMFIAVAVLYLLDAADVIELRTAVVVVVTAVGFGLAALAGAVWALLPFRRRALRD